MMWDLIVSVPDHCLSFYFEPNLPPPCCVLEQDTLLPESTG